MEAAMSFSLKTTDIRPPAPWGQKKEVTELCTWFLEMQQCLCLLLMEGYGHSPEPVMRQKAKVFAVLERDLQSSPHRGSHSRKTCQQLWTLPPLPLFQAERSQARKSHSQGSDATMFPRTPLSSLTGSPHLHAAGGRRVSCGPQCSVNPQIDSFFPRARGRLHPSRHSGVSNGDAHCLNPQGHFYSTERGQPALVWTECGGLPTPKTFLSRWSQTEG